MTKIQSIISGDLDTMNNTEMYLNLDDELDRNFLVERTVACGVED